MTVAFCARCLKDQWFLQQVPMVATGPGGGRVAEHPSYTTCVPQLVFGAPRLPLFSEVGACPGGSGHTATPFCVQPGPSLEVAHFRTLRTGWPVSGNQEEEPLRQVGD